MSRYTLWQAAGQQSSKVTLITGHLPSLQMTPTQCDRCAQLFRDLPPLAPSADTASWKQIICCWVFYRFSINITSADEHGVREGGLTQSRHAATFLLPQEGVIFHDWFKRRAFIFQMSSFWHWHEPNTGWHDRCLYSSLRNSVFPLVQAAVRLTHIRRSHEEDWRSHDEEDHFLAHGVQKQHIWCFTLSTAQSQSQSPFYLSISWHTKESKWRFSLSLA